MSALADKIVEYVRERDYVSFVEITAFVKPHLPTTGDFAIRLDNEKNIVAWAGMSDELSSLILGLLKERRIGLYPACYMTYLIDGAVLNMRIAKRIKKYKHERWMPVVFRVRS